MTLPKCVALVSVAYQCMAPATPHVLSSLPRPKPGTYLGCRVECPGGGYRMMRDVDAMECRRRMGSGTCTYQEVWR